jgi:hypothetical protein
LILTPLPINDTKEPSVGMTEITRREFRALQTVFLAEPMLVDEWKLTFTHAVRATLRGNGWVRHGPSGVEVTREGIAVLDEGEPV